MVYRNSIVFYKISYFSDWDSVGRGVISTASPSSHINSQMGIILNKILNSFADMKSKILMLGLDGAGKTTILYQMKLN